METFKQSHRKCKICKHEIILEADKLVLEKEFYYHYACFIEKVITQKKNKLELENAIELAEKLIVENKDRTLAHKQDEILVEPTLMDWQIVIDRNRGKKSFVNNNNLGNAVLKEMEDAEKKDMNFDSAVYGKAETDKVNAEPKTVEEYQKFIKDMIESWDKVKKSEKQGEIAAAELPKAYQKITDLDVLKKYVEILKK